MRTIWKILIGIVLIAALALLAWKVALSPQETPENTEQKTEKEVPAPLSPQAGLPTVVETKRQAIAAAKNFEELAALAAPDISYSFGGPYEGGFASYLQMEEDNTGIDLLERIDALLSLPYSKRSDIYVWPGLSEKTPADWTAEDIRALETIATDKEIEQYREFGGYIGWRLGIREDGTWIYFIAGD